VTANREPKKQKQKMTAVTTHAARRFLLATDNDEEQRQLLMKETLRHANDGDSVVLLTVFPNDLKNDVEFLQRNLLKATEGTEASGVRTTAVAAFGSHPGQVVVEYAREHPEIDVVVVGVGRRDDSSIRGLLDTVGRKLTGSNSKYIFEHAPCSVLALRMVTARDILKKIA
jgi:nucleotide-binding universal stress UspA family protein